MVRRSAAGGVGLWADRIWMAVWTGLDGGWHGMARHGKMDGWMIESIGLEGPSPSVDQPTPADGWIWVPSASCCCGGAASDFPDDSFWRARVPWVLYSVSATSISAVRRGTTAGAAFPWPVADCLPSITVLEATQGHHDQHGAPPAAATPSTSPRPCYRASCLLPVGVNGVRVRSAALHLVRMTGHSSYYVLAVYDTRRGKACPPQECACPEIWTPRAPP